MPNGSPTPTDEVVSMQKSGKTVRQITDALQKKGYSLEQVNEAINQANIKSGVEGGVPLEFAPPQPLETMQESVLVPPTPEGLEAPAPPTPEQPAAPSYIPQAPRIMPQQPMPMQQEPSINYEDVQALVEEVIDERWKELLVNIGDIPTWKSEMTNDVEAIKQELLRVERRFEDLQTAIFGKVKEYGVSMKDLGAEMKAFEKVFEKILEPMTTNIKELEKITGQLKAKK